MINIGIIGAGRIGKVHAESISRFVKNAKVMAIADPMIGGNEAQLKAQFGIESVFTDYKKILNDKNIDAVLICSPTDTHSKISLEALSAGKHVFCEKPVDHDVKKIIEVMEAVKKSNLKYQVGFNRRFDHNFAAAKKAVVEGKIGELNILKITSRDPAPPSIDYVKVSGGMFLDMTIHDFDMARFISNSEVEEVYAKGKVLVDKKIGEAGDIDTAIVTLSLKNGALAVIDNCRRSSYGYDQRVEAFGSLGQVAVNNDTASTAVLSTADGVNAEKPLHFFLERYMAAYVLEITEFVNSIVENKPVLVGIEDGLKPVLIGLAAKLSLKENRAVKISELEKMYGLVK